jgi:hypothetical protein
MVFHASKRIQQNVASVTGIAGFVKEIICCMVWMEKVWPGREMRAAVRLCFSNEASRTD